MIAINSPNEPIASASLRSTKTPIGTDVTTKRTRTAEANEHPKDSKQVANRDQSAMDQACGIRMALRYTRRQSSISSVAMDREAAISKMKCIPPMLFSLCGLLYAE